MLQKVKADGAAVVLALLSAISFASPGAAQAAVITASPPSGTPVVGGPVSVMVSITELIEGSAPSLGAFDITVDYDPAILSLTTTTWGAQLSLGVESFRFLDDTVSGSVSVGEVSFDSEADLNTLQPGAFLLFMLTFEALSAGTSGIFLTSNALADAGAGELFATLHDTSVTVNPVPIPAAVWLLLLGFAALMGIARRARKEA